MMKAQHSSGRPYTIAVGSNLLDEGSIHTCEAAVGCTSCNQFLYAVFERPSKVSVAPELAVTTDPCVVEGDSLVKTRCVLHEKKLTTMLSVTKLATRVTHIFRLEWCMWNIARGVHFLRLIRL